jgi:hypothetical protein
MEKENNTFVDSDVMEPLPPIFKGKRIKIYPGNLAKRTGNVRRSENGGGIRGSRRFGLRRYVFRYEGNKFVYLATRKGQRNGGYNSTPQQAPTLFALTATGDINTGELSFRYSGQNDDNEDIYTETANSRIRYDSSLNRWQWETRPATVPPAPPAGPFFVNAYSEVTFNTLRNSGASNQIRWTYVSDPYDTALPELPATVRLKTDQWFNNNTLENLNNWPIVNIDMNNGLYSNTTYKWIKYEGGNVVPENRPECLSDDLLLKCFQGVKLKQYDTVFIEVMWTWFEYRRGDSKFWGYNIHNYEWWSPAPFLTQRQKGRIYRIGILDKDNGVGKTDKVLFAQRTRTVTTRYFRGGNTVLE